jgi:hypothetical protein
MGVVEVGLLYFRGLCRLGVWATNPFWTWCPTSLKYCHVSRLCVICRRGLGWMIGFIDTLYIQLGSTRNYSATAIYTLYSSPLNTHEGFQFSLVVSWQQIYNSALSLQITYEVFFSQPNSFLVIILQLPIPKTGLGSIPLLSSSCLGRLASRNSTRLLSSELNPFARTTQKTQHLFLGMPVYSAVA